MTVGQASVSTLWNEFFRTRSQEARNELVMQYVHLVKTIVYRMVPTYKKHVEFDDLMSCGIMGLMDAIDRFRPDKEVKFETYASLRIKGEIIDQIRKQDWIPISLRQKIKRVEEAFSILETTYGRIPAEQEVADYLGIKKADLQKTLDEGHMLNVIAIDDEMAAYANDEGFLSKEKTPEAAFEFKEMCSRLAQQIDRLPEKEKLVLSLYYYDEMTLKEIGRILNVSESRVSQIHSKAIMLLRSKMAD